MKIRELRALLLSIESKPLWDEAEVTVLTPNGVVPATFHFHSTAEIKNWPEAPTCKMTNYEVLVQADPNDSAEQLAARRGAMSDQLGPPFELAQDGPPRARWQR